MSMAARRIRSRDAGATSVEFALVLPLFLTLIAGVLVFGLAMFYAGLAEHAARTGLRKAVIRTSTGYPGAAAVRSTINTSLAGLLPDPTNSNATLVVRDPVDAAVNPRGAQGDRVTVTVEYDLPAVGAALRLIPDNALRAAMADLATVERTAEGRLE